MPRPTNKTQLLEFAKAKYQRLQDEIVGLSDEQMIEGGIVGEWSVKDVLAHLYEWQQMTLSWYRTGKSGDIPITPSPKYTWREIPALNQEIYETYRDIDLAKIQSDLETSHQEAISLIGKMTDDELFTPKVYKWTKSTTLGSYLTSATSSHYDWARKEIRKGLKVKQKS